MKLIMLFLFLINFSYAYADHEFTTLNSNLSKKYKSTIKDTAEVNRITQDAFKLMSKKGSLEKVKEYLDSAVLICEKRNIEIPARLHLLIAEYQYNTGDYRSASEAAAIAMKLSALKGEYEVLARTKNFLAKYYNFTKFYKESIEYYDSSISISQKEGLKGLIPVSYLGKAEVYRSIKDTSSYRINLQKMINAALVEKNSSLAAMGYSLLGTSYCGETINSNFRNFRLADSLFKICLTISVANKDSGRTAYALANSGWNFYLENRYDSSLKYYQKSLKYSIPAENYGAAANSLGNIGTIYRDLGKYNDAIYYYSIAIDNALKVKDVYNLRWIYKDKSELYLKLKDTSNAFKNYVLFKKYNDYFLMNETNQGLESAKVRYEADTHNKEMELLSLRLKNNRILIFGLALLIIFILIIGFLLLRASNLKNKRRISEMNRKISELTQANLRQQMNPHFIFNTLNSIQYYMYQHDKLSTNNYLTKFSNLMRKVLDNSQHTSVALNDELSALSLYLELECIRFKDKFEFKINVDEEIDPLMYKVPTMLIQPYVENSICHGLMPKEDKGFVKIDISLNRDHLLCTIEDNGIGREAARERNSKREGNHNSLGTQITTSRLDLVNALYGTSLKTVYTDMKNEKGEPGGTRVEIHIPIMS